MYSRMFCAGKYYCTVISTGDTPKSKDVGGMGM